jgi:hypothetical protein
MKTVGEFKDRNEGERYDEKVIGSDLFGRRASEVVLKWLERDGIEFKKVEANKTKNSVTMRGK